MRLFLVRPKTELGESYAWYTDTHGAVIAAETREAAFNLFIAECFSNIYSVDPSKFPEMFETISLVPENFTQEEIIHSSGGTG